MASLLMLIAVAIAFSTCVSSMTWVTLSRTSGWLCTCEVAWMHASLAADNINMQHQMLTDRRLLASLCIMSLLRLRERSIADCLTDLAFVAIRQA